MRVLIIGRTLHALHVLKTGHKLKPPGSRFRLLKDVDLALDLAEQLGILAQLSDFPKPKFVQVQQPYATHLSIVHGEDVRDRTWGAMNTPPASTVTTWPPRSLPCLLLKSNECWHAPARAPFSNTTHFVGMRKIRTQPQETYARLPYCEAVNIGHTLPPAMPNNNGCYPPSSKRLSGTTGMNLSSASSAPCMLRSLFAWARTGNRVEVAGC